MLQVPNVPDAWPRVWHAIHALELSLRTDAEASAVGKFLEFILQVRNPSPISLLYLRSLRILSGLTAIMASYHLPKKDAYSFGSALSGKFKHLPFKLWQEVASRQLKYMCPFQILGESAGLSTQTIRSLTGSLAKENASWR